MGRERPAARRGGPDRQRVDRDRVDRTRQLTGHDGWRRVGPGRDATARRDGRRGCRVRSVVGRRGAALTGGTLGAPARARRAVTGPRVGTLAAQSPPGTAYERQRSVARARVGHVGPSDVRPRRFEDGDVPVRRLDQFADELTIASSREGQTERVGRDVRRDVFGRARAETQGQLPVASSRVEPTAPCRSSRGSPWSLCAPPAARARSAPGVTVGGRSAGGVRSTAVVRSRSPLGVTPQNGRAERPWTCAERPQISDRRAGSTGRG